MATPSEIREFYQLSELVDLKKSPAAFLRNLLFKGPARRMHAENLEVRTRVGDRLVAPMTSRLGEAKFIQRELKTGALIHFPRIALRWALQAGEVFSLRGLVDNPYASESEILSQWDLEIAEHQERAADMIANRIELMISQLLVGTMSYSDAEGDSWEYVSPKPAANNMTAAVDWDNLVADPMDDIMAAKALTSDYAGGVSPDVMILGTNAMAAFLHNESVRGELTAPSGINGIRVGNLDFTTTYDREGAIFMGMYGGLQVWGYSRQVSVAGTLTDLIRPDYAELVSTQRAADAVLYYGPLYFVDQRLEMDVFSHSWKTPDGKSQCFEIETRPMPVFRKPGANVSIHVVS